MTTHYTAGPGIEPGHPNPPTVLIGVGIFAVGAILGALVMRNRRLMGAAIGGAITVGAWIGYGKLTK